MSCRLTLCLLASLAISCGDRPLRFLPPHPTAEEISALARSTIGDRVPSADVAETGLTLTVYPRVILQGGATWVRCLVPPSYGRGRVLVAVNGIMSSERPLDGSEYRHLVEHLPCGTYEAVCVVSSARGLERRTQQLEVRGGMCDGGER